MVSVSLTQGRRPHMEDTYIVDEIKKKKWQKSQSMGRF